ncbi:type IV secretion protein Rhs, partial [Pseudomonas cichorii]|nr:type IV secretion protein Rhs [Pseudomonas cichorii]
GLNNYRYVPNPTGWVDPLGLATVPVDCPGATPKRPNNTANATKPDRIPMTQEKYDEVINLERGNRPPDTREYLPEQYVGLHEEAFKQQGSSFVVIDAWIEKSKYPTFPPRKFVGLPSEMDAVVAKYKASGNNWEVLNRELNLGDDDLSDLKIYLVKIKPGDPRFKYEIPNGNEAGAYPKEWVPGGETKSGTKEAALIGSESIDHGKDMNKLLSQFDDWEQLQ